MTVSYEIGDLVHIPQATELIDCEFVEEVQEQLTIPLRLVQTNRPEIGVITYANDRGLLRVLWDGVVWSINEKNVFKLKEVKGD
jgi:hypothetical protein